MELNFDAQLRLTEALLPLLRRSAPSAIVNVASAAARVARPGTAAYSASKAALAVWSDGLRAEEAPHGVHVGDRAAGLHPDGGLPAARAGWRGAARAGCWARPSRPPRRSPTSRSSGGAERYVPRFYGALAALRTIAPPLVRRAMARGGADRLATTTRE